MIRHATTAEATPAEVKLLGIRRVLLAVIGVEFGILSTLLERLL